MSRSCRRPGAAGTESPLHSPVQGRILSEPGGGFCRVPECLQPRSELECSFVRDTEQNLPAKLTRLLAYRNSDVTNACWFKTLSFGTF